MCPRVCVSGAFSIKVFLEICLHSVHTLVVVVVAAVVFVSCVVAQLFNKIQFCMQIFF